MSTGVSERRPRPRLRIATSPDRRIADLLKRYPNVSTLEMEELRQFINSAIPLEVQRIRSDRKLRPLFDRVVKDVRGPLPGRAAAGVATLLAVLLMAVWLW